MAYVAVALGLVLVMLACGLLIAVHGLTRPARAVVAEPPAELGLTTVEFRSGNGALLRAWHAPATRPDGLAVALFHGVWGNREATLARIAFLREQGFGILAIDFQAHGESEGRRISFGARESADAAAALAWLRQHHDGKVLAIGASLGGAALLLGRDPPDADALVLESVYTSIDLAVRNRMKLWLPRSGTLLTPVLVTAGELVLGLSRRTLRPLDRMAGLTMPVLVADGTLDDKTSPEETRAMAAAGPPGTQLWLVEGAGHEDLHAFAPQLYRERLMAFIATAIPEPRGRNGACEAAG